MPKSDHVSFAAESVFLTVAAEGRQVGPFPAGADHGEHVGELRIGDG